MENQDIPCRICYSYRRNIINSSEYISTSQVVYNLSLIIGWEVALQVTVAITITTQRVSLLYHQIYLIVKFVTQLQHTGRAWLAYTLIINALLAFDSIEKGIHDLRYHFTQMN